MMAFLAVLHQYLMDGFYKLSGPLKCTMSQIHVSHLSLGMALLALASPESRPDPRPQRGSSGAFFHILDNHIHPWSASQCYFHKLTLAIMT